MLPLSGAVPMAVIDGAIGTAGSKPAWDLRLAGKEESSFDAIRLSLATLIVFEHSYFLISNRSKWGSRIGARFSNV